MKKNLLNFILNFLKIFTKKFTKKFFLYLFLLIGVLGVNTVLAQTDDVTSSDFMISVGSLDPIYGDTAKTTSTGTDAVKHILEVIGNVFLMLIPLLGGVAFVIAGYFYIFSYADSDNITKAKTIIKYNIIAIIVAFMSGWIIHIIASLF